MINIIVKLLLKKGWMLFSNLFVSLILFFIVGAEEWAIILTYLSLNMMGLLLGSGIKSKSSLSKDKYDITINYFSMVIINIITIIYIYVYSVLKNIDNNLILIISLVLILITNLNSFYQGLMINLDKIKESTNILVKANIIKMITFFLLLIFYRKVYLFFILQLIEQLYIYKKSTIKLELKKINLSNIIIRLKELFFIAIGSMPFIFVSSNLQLDLSKIMTTSSAGYLGLFSQVINSLRGLIIFLVTNFQKIMIKYSKYYTKIIGIIFISIFLIFIANISIFLYSYLPYNVMAFCLIVFINIVYVLILIIGNMQNIYNMNVLSFYAAIIFLIFSFVGFFIELTFIESISYTLLTYIFSMLVRVYLVNYLLKKGVSND
ncbi:hypothetical protein [Acinetobacter sp. G11]|uniref:hypothetical protein n=1 Tax=Acinetobacter sp. G11 TaxID=3415989 RepID=UPI003C7B609B